MNGSRGGEVETQPNLRISTADVGWVDNPPFHFAQTNLRISTGKLSEVAAYICLSSNLAVSPSL
ncbi:MAG: hypothetical protein KME19_11640 [Microcoleus vaginatus WJT46-NPBG5]|nr:hypothetical protein [Microcoleus vaginatus WJT46-NPBG5]